MWSTRTSISPSRSAAARKRKSSSGLTVNGPPQSAYAGGGRGTRGLVRGAERGPDLGVGKVVAIAEHDGGPLGRRQPAGQVLELAEGLRRGLGGGDAVDLGR